MWEQLPSSGSNARTIAKFKAEHGKKSSRPNLRIDAKFRPQIVILPIIKYSMNFLSLLIILLECWWNFEITMFELYESFFLDVMYTVNWFDFQVPSLEHNGKIIGESIDLIKYVDSNFEGPSLVPNVRSMESFYHTSMTVPVPSILTEVIFFKML